MRMIINTKNKSVTQSLRLTTPNIPPICNFLLFHLFSKYQKYDNIKQNEDKGHKKMKLYIVRHGQTGYNIDNKVCGISDVELTSLGKQQAKMASEQLKDISLDMILLHHFKEHMKLQKS
mgnify:CR=1 FL=1